MLSGPIGGFGALADMSQTQAFGDDAHRDTERAPEDLKPDADVFDTPEAFIVQVSLPGAKKEDVVVNWTRRGEAQHRGLGLPPWPRGAVKDRGAG